MRGEPYTIRSGGSQQASSTSSAEAAVHRRHSAWSLERCFQVIQVLCSSNQRLKQLAMLLHRDAGGALHDTFRWFAKASSTSSAEAAVHRRHSAWSLERCFQVIQVLCSSNQRLKQQAMLLHRDAGGALHDTFRWFATSFVNIQRRSSSSCCSQPAMVGLLDVQHNICASPVVCPHERATRLYRRSFDHGSCRASENAVLCYLFLTSGVSEASDASKPEAGPDVGGTERRREPPVGAGPVVLAV